MSPAATVTVTRCPCGAAVRCVSRGWWTCSAGHAHLVGRAAAVSVAPTPLVAPSPPARAAAAAAEPQLPLPTPKQRRRFRRLVKRVTNELLKGVDARTAAKRGAMERNRRWR
jgi:hypothetical protein